MHESREARRSFRGRFFFSTKELLFLIGVCVIGAFLYSGAQESARLLISWEEYIDPRLFDNHDFPLDHEKLPQPVVSDIDGDGVSEIILFTTDEIIKLSLSTFNYKHNNEALRLKNTVQLPLAVNSTVRPIALATGFTKVFNNLVELRVQVVVVLLSDFTVLCYNHKLDLLLWSIKLTHNKDISNMVIREAAILVSPTALLPGDKGSVIVGGRLSVQGNPLFRNTEKIKDKMNYDSLGHYTVYAIHARDGAMRWKHEPGDFESTLPYSVEDISSFQHYKLTLHRTVAHVGEVSWQQYSQSLSRSLPHSWEHNSDTVFRLAHFTKDKKSDDPDISDHISKVGMLARERVANMMPSPPKEEPLNTPNVVLIHSQKGVEVLHLYQGRPLCSLPLPPLHTSHADIDADGTIDHISAVVTHPEAGDDQPPTITAGEGILCYGKATRMWSEKVIFKHPICSHLGWLENVIKNLVNIIPKATPFPISDYIPNLSHMKRARPAHHLGAEALSPVIVESAHHSGLQLHFSKAAASMNKGIYYDTIFVLNTGRVTSIGPHGEINWQVDSPTEWLKGPRDSSANEELFTAVENLYFFLTQTFTPSALAVSLTPGGVEDHLLIVGWTNMVLHNNHDGEDIVRSDIPCPPVNRPVVKDFSNDGFNDIILTCRNKYIGINLYKDSALWSSTVISTLIGIIILIVLHHVRLKFSDPFVVAKEAVD